MKRWAHQVWLVGLVIVGCDGGATRPPCDDDDDCAAGTFCATGGCDFVCRLDIDCQSQGGGTCDTARGRCVGGTMDGGPCDAAACDDGVYCNGAERCEAGACTTGEAPCMAGQTCDEAADACSTICTFGADADGDGADSLDCGGDDCDDGDALRFPGNTEVCDPRNLDEDCDPCTVGSPGEAGLGGDADGDEDGFWNQACCNRFMGDPPACPESPGRLRFEGALACGTDCDDTRGGVFPGASEACDSMDNDCDGERDEDGRSMWWPDGDADGHGARGSEPILSCMTPSGHASNDGDCDDTNNAIFPGATDLCDGIDSDCTAPTDPPSCGCLVGQTTMCGYSPTTCAPVTGSCTTAGTFDCPSGLILGSEAETCDGRDNNCNGSVDEGDPGGGAACGSIGTPCQGTNHCSGGVVQCFPARSPTGETCNNVDDDCNGIVDSISETQSITCSASAVTQQSRSCSSGAWSGWTTTSTGSQSCSRCGGRTTGTQSCQTNGALTDCTASWSGEFTSERCSSYCPGTTWPYGHVSCVSNMVWCTPDLTSGSSNVWRIEGNSGVLGHDCGSSYGSSDWYVDHNAVGGNCAAVWFYHGMPPGTYRITYHVYRTGPRGAWPNVLGVDLYHGGEYRFSDYRVPEGHIDLIVDNVRHNTYCSVLDLGLVYRGGYWTDSMVLDYVLLERLAP